jgi:hypothetical protein
MRQPGYPLQDIEEVARAMFDLVMELGGLLPTRQQLGQRIKLYREEVKHGSR